MTSSIFWIGFALSKGPHFNGVYLLGVRHSFSETVPTITNALFPFILKIHNTPSCPCSLWMRPLYGSHGKVYITWNIFKVQNHGSVSPLDNWVLSNLNQTESQLMRFFLFTQYSFQIILGYWVVWGGELEPWIWILGTCKVMRTLV